MGLKTLCAAVVAGVLLAGAPAMAKPLPQVVGGDISTDKYPWLVSIAGARGHVCGGSLIASRWVLTAAHCLDAAQSAGFPVSVGSRDDAPKVKARQAIRHPGYDPATLANDIGLLELPDPVSGVTPIPLQNFDIWESAPVRALGWGVSGNVDSTGSAQLRQADDRVVPGGSCDWAADVYHADQMYCFSSEKGSPCLFDSGGPVLSRDPASGRWRLTAVIAGGDTYCPNGTDYPWFGTSAVKYRPWIVTYTGLLHAPGPF